MIKKKSISIIASITIALVVGIYIGYKKGIPFVSSPPLYAIGIYSGSSPFDMTPRKSADNPVITADDVTDIKAAFVADPFMIEQNGTWYMFFEVMNKTTNQGDIGLATSKDLDNWQYQKIVIDEPYHLSYPFVFKHKNDIYMIPESSANYDVRLYKAVTFPTQWKFEKTLLTGNYVDSTVFQHEHRWWMLTAERNDVLHLFYAEDLKGEWVKHPQSPIILKDPNIARPSGRVIQHKNNLYRLAQDCHPEYGMLVRAFRIDQLTTTSYQETPIDHNPILSPDSESRWNSIYMHHMDAHNTQNKWIGCVDGVGPYLQFGLDQ